VAGSEWRPLLDRLSSTRGRQVEVRELAGGLSNRVLRVTAVDRGPALDLVVRLPPRGPVSADRAAEHRNTVTAAAAGVAPPVLEALPDGTLVVAHLDARTLGPADVRADLGRVAALCRRLHAGPRFVGRLDLAAVQRRYRSLVAERGSWLPPGHRDLTPEVDTAIAALAADPVPTVPCHNDLPGGNVLDDGARLWLVDFEFAAEGDPWCDLGNLASGAALAPGEVDELVTAYAGAVLPSRVARTRLWDAVCSWTWVLWASLQDAAGELDHDYRSMGEALAERAREGLDRQVVRRLVEELAAPVGGTGSGPAPG
jgi:thiamine kinase-like enzyme